MLGPLEHHPLDQGGCCSSPPLSTSSANVWDSPMSSSIRRVSEPESFRSLSWTRILFRDTPPQRPDHILHSQCVLPAIRQFRAVRPGDGIGRRAEFTQEGQHRIGARAFAPGADGVFPPAHEQFDPALVLRKAQRDLYLFATRDPSVDAPTMIENAMDHRVVDLVHRPGEFAADEIMRNVSG